MILTGQGWGRETGLRQGNPIENGGGNRQKGGRDTVPFIGQQLITMNGPEYLRPEPALPMVDSVLCVEAERKKSHTTGALSQEKVRPPEGDVQQKCILLEARRCLKMHTARGATLLETPHGNPDAHGLRNR